jgi:osmotically-inducible protein OsmY
MSDNRAAGRAPPLRGNDKKSSKENLAVPAEAQSRLRTSNYGELHLVSCEFHEGLLTLRGHVSSFHLKQLAQTLVRDLDGVGEINNRLEVAEPRNNNKESVHE